MRPPVPPALTTEAPRRRPWVGVVTSILVHGTLISLVLWHEARPAFLLRPHADSVEIAARRPRRLALCSPPPAAPPLAAPAERGRPHAPLPAGPAKERHRPDRLGRGRRPRLQPRPHRPSGRRDAPGAGDAILDDLGRARGLRPPLRRLAPQEP